MEAHKIVSQVQDAYKKVVANLARLTGKHPETFHSHGREPKTHNPLSSGNVSPVTHYLQYCRQYDAAEHGAGKMMNNRVHAMLADEFAENDECSNKEFHSGVLKESFDVLDCLNKYELESVDLQTLRLVREEASQLRDKASDLVAYIDNRIKRNTGKLDINEVRTQWAEGKH